MTRATRRLDRLLALPGTWRRRRRFRAELKRLLRVGDGMIRDIGLDPEAARAESRKPIWRA